MYGSWSNRLGLQQTGEIPKPFILKIKVKNVHDLVEFDGKMGLVDVQVYVRYDG